jgi:PAS domain S-box-containing protein
MLVRGKPLSESRLAPELWAPGGHEALAEWMMDHAPAMVAYVDDKLRYVRVNQLYEDFFGRPVADIEGRSVAEVMGPQFEKVRHELKAALKGESRKFELSMVLRDGERMLEANYIPDVDSEGRVRGLMVCAFDVTERWHAQRALEQSEEQLRLALSATNGVGVWNWDVDRDVVVADKGFADLFELTEELAAQGIPRQVFAARVHPDDVGEVRTSLRLALTGAQEFSTEYRVMQSDGSVRWVMAVGRSVRDGEGRPLRLHGLTLDITERKTKEEALRASEARFHSIYETSLEYVGILDAAGVVLDCNRASLEFAGMTHADVVGKKFWECPWFLYTPGAAEMVRGAVERAAEGQGLRTELPLLRPTGETTTFAFSLEPVFGPDGKVELIVPEGRDITDLKQAQMALLQSEKLAAVGRLASSIAHEINNPLEAVTNLLYLARTTAMSAEAKEYLDTADHELRRISAIASQTLRFHRQATSPQAVEASELFESVLGIFDRRMKNLNIRVEEDYRATQPIVCFEGDVRQVLNNLVGNAIDAMSDGGRLLMRSHDATDWKTKRKGIVLTVADTGCGMSRETVGRIYEPFFTTKGIAGTGLELWVSSEVVSRHKGSLQVRSKSGAGTVFRLFLPYQSQVR